MEDATDEGTSEKGKGKEKETGKKEKRKKKEDGWSIVGGAARCSACQCDSSSCKINVGAIEKWREDVRAGKVFGRTPTNTGCKKCLEDRRKRCELPATEEMRKAMRRETKGKGKEKEDSLTPSAASSKRSLEFAGVEMPPMKRRRGDTVVEGGQRQADLWEMLRRATERVAESSAAGAAASERLARAVEGLTVATDRQNSILGELVKMLASGAGTSERAKGKEKEVVESSEVSEESERSVEIVDVRKEVAGEVGEDSEEGSGSGEESGSGEGSGDED